MVRLSTAMLLVCGCGTTPVQTDGGVDAGGDVSSEGSTDAAVDGEGGSSTQGVHGLFILNPPPCDVSVNFCNQQLIPTLICSGSGTPPGYNCKQAGAGEPYITGATYYIAWKDIAPDAMTFDFATTPDKHMKPWIDFLQRPDGDELDQQHRLAHHAAPLRRHDGRTDLRALRR